MKADDTSHKSFVFDILQRKKYFAIMSLFVLKSLGILTRRKFMPSPEHPLFLVMLNVSRVVSCED